MLVKPLAAYSFECKSVRLMDDDSGDHGRMSLDYWDQQSEIKKGQDKVDGIKLYFNNRMNDL